MDNSTIAAVATGEGGAIAIVRVSGPEAIAACDALFVGTGGRRLAEAPGYSLRHGTFGPAGGEAVDEVLVSLFRAPHSYTGEDMVEIGCHGSPYIRAEILRLLGREGVRAAAPGEFTLRAYLHGKMDLSQAEAVADLIAADSRASHTLAINQLRGRYSAELAALRGRLVELAALLELELDFSDEDVEFADRRQIGALMDELAGRIGRLRDSYAAGNALKSGIPVALVGTPNVGKSTLLNALLGEERALVSDIPGTTRDAIEASVVIGGIRFRFVDTAGIRDTTDPLEAMGIERTHRHLDRAAIVLPIVEATAPAAAILAAWQAVEARSEQQTLMIINKIDRNPAWQTLAAYVESHIGVPVVAVSARTGEGVDALTARLHALAAPSAGEGATIVTNARHHEALSAAAVAIGRAAEALRAHLPADLLAEEIRAVLDAIGTITGDTPPPEEILQTIFSRFCIGK